VTVAAPDRRTARVLIFTGLLVTLAIPAAAPFWPAQEAIRVDDRPVSTHPVSRPIMWRTALRITRDRPWTGTGFTTFDRVYSAYQPLPGRLGPPPHAHNLLLTFAAEAGVPGAIAVTVFLGSGIAAIWRWRSHGPPGDPQRDLAVATLGAAAALLGHQALDGTLMGSGTVFALYALFGLGTALLPRGGAGRPT
jgi:O-antigen ligase